MDLDHRGPKPDSDLRPCQFQCGGVYTDDQRLAQITCPCGFGYYDKNQHRFITGALVRGGNAPTREEYVAHVRRCEHRQYGAPVVGQLFLGVKPAPALQNAKHKDAETYGHRRAPVDEPLPYRQQAADVEQAITTSRAPRQQHASIERGNTISAATRKQNESSDRTTSLNASMSRKNQTPISTEQEEEYVLPKGCIEEEPLCFYLQFILKKDVEIRETNEDYIIHGIRSLSEADLREIEKDSKDWAREMPLDGDVLRYEDSRVAEKRRQNGANTVTKQARPVERDKPPLKRNTSSYDQEKTRRNLPLSSTPDSSNRAKPYQSAADNLSTSPQTSSSVYGQPVYTPYPINATPTTRPSRADSAIFMQPHGLDPNEGGGRQLITSGSTPVRQRGQKYNQEDRRSRDPKDDREDRRSHLRDDREDRRREPRDDRGRNKR